MSRTTILTGDFNFHFHSNKHPHSDFIDLCNKFNLYQHNCFPTHIHGHTLDLIFTTLDSLLITAPSTNSTLITDHYAIDYIININTPTVIKKITSFRNLKANLLTPNITIYEQRKINKFKLKTPVLSYLTSAQHKSFSVHAPKIYNDLPYYIRSIDSTVIFKSNFKNTFFLNKYIEKHVRKLQ